MRAVLMPIADAANRDGEHARPGLAAIIEGSLYGKSHVSRILTRLIEEGWLGIEEQGNGRGTATVYRVQMEETSPPVGGSLDRNLPISRPKPPHFQTETSPSGDSAPLSPTVTNNGRDTTAAPQPSVSEPQTLLDSASSETSKSATARERSKAAEEDQVRAVFEAWVLSTGRTAATRLDAKRQKFIADALRNYPLADVLDAVKGWEHSAHHRGDNDRGTTYNDLGLLLRDAGNIERFRDFARGPRQPSRRSSHLPANDRALAEDPNYWEEP